MNKSAKNLIDLYVIGLVHNISLIASYKRLPERLTEIVVSKLGSLTSPT